LAQRTASNGLDVDSAFALLFTLSQLYRSLCEEYVSDIIGSDAAHPEWRQLCQAAVFELNPLKDNDSNPDWSSKAPTQLESPTNYAYRLYEEANSVDKTVVTIPLSKREMEIVRLAASGLSNCEVSQRLSLSESTVKNYLVRVYEKLGISTRIELILYILSYHRSPESEENKIAAKTFKISA
jgi:DNA-binding CsgD family transcriptional regulator